MQRRDFLKASAVGLAGTMIPAQVMKAANSAPAASAAPAKTKDGKRIIRLGFIGLGQQCMYLLSSFIKMDDVRVVAGCDVYDIKRSRFAKKVKDYYTEKGENPKKIKCDMYVDYQDLLARPDIDAVVIATPDHQHAIIGIAACKAGKDIYLEKPLTLTIYEGQQLCKAVRKYNRILQVGSQQRSSEEFIHAATLCREGLLGKIQKIKVCAGRNEANPYSAAPVDNPLPVMPVPAGLDWDKWLGPMTDTVKYHSDLDPIVTDDEGEKLWGAWRWYKPTGGGLMTDWGAHMFDIAQWAIGKDGSGPVEIVPPGYGQYDELTYIYDNGTVITEEEFDGDKRGLKIFGEKGWIQVCRGEFIASSPEFDLKKTQNEDDIPYEARGGHHRVFIDSVVSRHEPNVPVETGHSSCVVCTLGNIAMELNRPLKWNPIVQKFMNDPEATEKLQYKYRPGYSLDI